MISQEDHHEVNTSNTTILSSTPQSVHSPIPAFWNTNLPPHLHTSTCPSFLQYAYTDLKDLRTLSTPDSAFRPQTWQELAHLIGQNRLREFQRVPSELYRYRRFLEDVKEKWGSVLRFLVKERLEWEVDELGSVVVDDGDEEGEGVEYGLGRADLYKILPNDWPYGFSPNIIHLVVWTKLPFPVDTTSPTGDLSPAVRRAIQDFVDRTFGSVCGGSNVLWFWNGTVLKSVDAVEHFHVLLRDAKKEWIDEWTGGKQPLAVLEKEEDG